MSKEVLNDIVEWSVGLPVWQQDALRKLACGEEVDAREYTKLCLAEVGFPHKDLRNPVPMTAQSISPGKDGGASTAIKSISNIVNVNAIKDGARIDFNTSGLVVVYGENGTGKSGYTRILKDSCRCLAPKKQVRGNIYSKDHSRPCSAVICYEINGKDTEFTWEQGSCIDALSNVAVFDAECAAVYVNKENSVVFTPFGLDLLQKLIELCDDVSDNVKEYAEKHSAVRLELPKDLQETNAAKWYNGIKHTTPVSEINEKLKFSDVEEDELKHLTDALTQNDPDKRIRELSSQTQRMSVLKERFEKLASAFEANIIEGYNDLINAAVEAQAAAELATADAFKDAPVPGSGGQAWRQLWDSAKAFVAVAYPGTEEPGGDMAERCVLCQQELPTSVRGRLKTFEEYVKAKAASQLKDKLDSIEASVRAISQLPISDVNDEAIQNELTEELSAKIKSFITSAKSCAEIVTQCFADKKNIENLALAPNPTQELQSIIVSNSDAIKTQTAAKDEVKKAEMLSRFQELRAIKLFHENSQSILKMHGELAVLAALEKAIDSAKSTKITRQSNKLTDKYLTDAVKAAFVSRLAELFGGRRLVTLEKTRAGKGTAYFKVKLNAAETDAPVAEIVSEGEYRAIALASFLAELDLSPMKSAIAFDDPVSSLDQKRRKIIAEVLARLARDRQLIVFTHDLYFLAKLMEEAKDQVSIHELQLRSVGSSFGHVIDGTPMSVKNFKERALIIEKKAHEAKELFESGKVQLSDDTAYRAGSLMRQLCEHCVEKILLGGVVRRFDDAVHTDNDIISKHQLLKIEASDLDFIVDFMGSYSNYLHDKTVADDVPPPDYQTLQSDLAALRRWKNDFSKKIGAN
jgi:ABC-type histidine transport system ATPase subunit